MHDPNTVAFELGRWVTVWHRDPERGGDEDSCDWFGSNLSKANGWWPGEVDELNALKPEVRDAVMFIWWKFRRKLGRPWYRHPRWHFWHWRIQVHHWQLLRRWIWSRCCVCGGRFRYGESVVGWWGGDGYHDIKHCSCSETEVNHAVRS